MTREPLPLPYETRIAIAPRSYITRWTMYLAPLVFPIVGILAAMAGFAFDEQEWPTIGNLQWVAFLGIMAWFLWFLLGIGIAVIGPSFLHTGSKGTLVAIYIVVLAIVVFFSFRLGMKTGF